ncbi:hypothetical protein K438DRAFT_1952961 [Mycena galopus ATCC 62051]|nr:hypothetical protein K438DRAFT_1952961 [Mycena galopus ATCC 62051]
MPKSRMQLMRLLHYLSINVFAGAPCAACTIPLFSSTFSPGFHSLLDALKERDSQNRVEINIYLPGGVKKDDINNIIVQEVGAEKDAVTSFDALRPPQLGSDLHLDWAEAS